MFGMQYTLKFELTEDYVGPLEYYFFGDDDMWVFLDGRLVCDIGGVHSSVGAYVNLWDYIKKGDAGEHTLKFYYTERGLSGSTCYMQFTLPSVSQVPVTYQNGQLKVEKKVKGTANPDAEFSFEIEISPQDVTNNDYSIVRYSPDGTEVIETTLLTDGKGTFKLKANEYVIIDYLQYGTKYKITETDCAAYIVTSTHNDNVKPSNAKMARANTSGTEEGQTQNGYNSLVTLQTPRVPSCPKLAAAEPYCIQPAGLPCWRLRCCMISAGGKHSAANPSEQPEQNLIQIRERKKQPMKHVKKLLGLLLALTLSLTLCLPAFAAKGTNDDSGSITIKDAVEGHTYKAYQIFVLESYNTAADENGAYAYKANSVWEPWLKQQTQYVNIDAQGLCDLGPKY